MNTGSYTVASGVASCVLGVAGATALLTAPAGVGVPVTAAMACGIAFLCWPWLALPASIIGAPVVATALDLTDLTSVLAVQAGMLGAGALAILIRRVLRPSAETPVRTPLDKPMLALVAVLVVGTCYSLARGNPTDDVLTAAYQLAVVPGCFFLATHSLNTRRRLQSAGVVYVAATAALAGIELVPPGHHLAGDTGMLLAVAIPPVLATVLRTTGWHRLGLVVLLAGQLTGVVLAGTRPVWVATTLAVVVLLVRGTARIRVAIGLIVAAAVVGFLGAAAVSPHLVDEYATFGQRALPWSASLFGPGSADALSVFLTNPVIGAGLGQPASMFWTWLLASLGMVGLAAIVVPFVLVLWRGLAPRTGYVLAFAALTFGCYASLVVGGGTAVLLFVPASTLPAGLVAAHWELGLLPALTLVATRLTAPTSSPARRTPVGTVAGRHRGLPASPLSSVVRAALPAGPAASGGRHL